MSDNTLKQLRESLPWRPCVGIMLINHQGLIWTGERCDTPGAWQMPQGGIDPGESREQAGSRELEEEIGVCPDQVTLLAWTTEKLRYELPDHLLGKVWKGKYRGQEQDWCLARLEADDAVITIETKHPEFSRWRWATPTELIRDIVPFKRDVYTRLLEDFDLP